MQYARKSFSVMPGTSSGYRENYEKVFRKDVTAPGASSSYRERMIQRKDTVPLELRISEESLRRAIDILRREHIWTAADALKHFYVGSDAAE